MNCTLCSSEAEFYLRDEERNRDYSHCPVCDLRFMHPSHHLNETDERARYELHNNDVNDIRYQEYMRPIADWIAKHRPSGHGLDFGCGKGPILARLLEEKGHQIDLFDPYFYPDESYRKNRYDFCVAVETIEHFYCPQKEISHLKDLLMPDGALGLVTLLYRQGQDFKSWHYRLDPTHVCFYSEKTFSWIQKHFGFKTYESDGLKLNWLQL